MNEIMAFWAEWLRPSAGLPTVQWSILLAIAAAAGHLVQRYAGLPKVVAYSWYGLMAPAGTPKPVIDKLNAAVNAAVKRPDIVKLWSGLGAVPMSMTPEEFDKYLRGDIVKWADVVKKFPDKPQ